MDTFPIRSLKALESAHKRRKGHIRVKARECANTHGPRRSKASRHIERSCFNVKTNSIKTEAEKAFILRNQARINTLLTTGLPPVLAAALEGVEVRHISAIHGVNEVEYALLDWLREGTPPEPYHSTPEAILYALHPQNGGATIEQINIDNRAWWIGMKRLQERLAEFAALEIVQPLEITEGDVLTSPVNIHASDASKERGSLPEAIPAQKVRRERETDPTEEHLSRV